MFLIWLDLLPQMQAFEHRLPRGYEKSFSFEYEEKFCENGSSRFCINLT